jgi:hypothetical protein
MHQRIARTISAMATASTNSRRKVKAKLEGTTEQVEQQRSKPTEEQSSAHGQLTSAPLRSAPLLLGSPSAHSPRARPASPL